MTVEGFVLVKPDGELVTLYDYPEFIDHQELQNSFTTDKADAERRLEYYMGEGEARIVKATLVIGS